MPGREVAAPPEAPEQTLGQTMRRAAPAVWLRLSFAAALLAAVGAVTPDAAAADAGRTKKAGASQRHARRALSCGAADSGGRARGHHPPHDSRGPRRGRAGQRPAASYRPAAHCHSLAGPRHRAGSLGGTAQRLGQPYAHPAGVGLWPGGQPVISLVGEDGRLLDQARIALVIQQSAGAPQAKNAEPPAPSAQPPALSAAERASAEKVAARGDRELELGNIAQARQFYQRAAQMGLARGALMLGATYDARELARLRAIGVAPNPAEARRWYERALELGAPEAQARLAALAGGG